MMSNTSWPWIWRTVTSVIGVFLSDPSQAGEGCGDGDGRLSSVADATSYGVEDDVERMLGRTITFNCTGRPNRSLSAVVMPSTVAWSSW
jgi:hypothetical protein